MNAINLDPAIERTIHHRVGRGASFAITFEKDGAPWNIEDKDFKCTVKRWFDDDDDAAAIKLTIGDGLVIMGDAGNLNRLEFTIAPEDTDQPAVKHFWELVELTGVQTWFNGDFIFHKGKFSASGNTSITGTINILHEVITWTIHLLAFNSGTFDTTFDDTFE